MANSALVLLQLMCLHALVCQEYTRVSHNSSKSIELALHHQQLLFQPISHLLHLNLSARIVPYVSEVLHSQTHMSSKSVCNVVRAPNHKPFRVLFRANHHVESHEDWRRLVNKESVFYNLSQINKLQYPLDLEVVGDKVLVIFETGEVIFYTVQHLQLRQAKRISISQPNGLFKLAAGKIHALKQLNAALFVSAREAILLNCTDFHATILSNYSIESKFYSALVQASPQNINIYIAQGKTGISHYVVKKHSHSVQIQANSAVYLANTTKRITVSQLIGTSQMVKHALGESTFLALSPTHGLLTIRLPLLGSVDRVEAVRTAMTTQKCRLVRMQGSIVYLSCPHIIAFNIDSNKSEMSSMLSQLPVELISNADDLMSISQNRFEAFNNCTGTLQGGLESQTFHHSAALQPNYYVSVDDISVIMWEVNAPEYFLACRGNSKFVGHNTFTISTSSRCAQKQEETSQCCYQKYFLNLEIYADEPKHLLEIIAVALIVAIALVIASVLLSKRLRLNREYNELLEQEATPQNNRTQQSIVENQTQKNKYGQLFLKD